jgi:TatD DNase family protein
LYINIHSHFPPATGEWVLQNLNTPEPPEPLPGLYSMGIHPWYIHTDHWEKQLLSLQEYSVHPRVLAIGECGLDKLSTTGFSLQEQVFRAQLAWANSIGKPVVIHCVRAWEEVLKTLEDAAVTVPVIFHGYAKNEQLARRLIDKGYYISLGKALQLPEKESLLQVIPPGQLFLETDDAAISIGEIYTMAARALSIADNSLVLQIQKNAAAVFGNAFQL